MSNIQIAGLTMYGEYQATEGVLQFADLIDWYSGTSSKSDLRENVEGDGAFDIAREWRAGLAVSVEGWCEHSSWAAALGVIMDMRAALIPKTMVEMAVADVRGTSARRVSIRKLTIREDPGAAAFDWALDLFAPDPALYGEAVVTSTGLPTLGEGGLEYPIEYPLDWGAPGERGRLTVENPGKTDAFTDFEVSGGGMAGGFRIVNVATGRVLRYTASVLPGSTVYLDSRTGRVYVNSPEYDMTGNVQPAQWWAAPPESAQEIQFAALGPTTGTPILTARTRPAN